MQFRPSLLLTLSSLSLTLLISGCNSQSNQASPTSGQLKSAVQTKKPVSSVGLDQDLSVLTEVGDRAEISISAYYPKYLAGSSGRILVQDIDSISTSKQEETFIASENGKTTVTFEVTLNKSGRFFLPVEVYITNAETGLTQGAIEKIQILDLVSANTGNNRLEKTSTEVEAPNYPNIIEMPSQE